MAKEEQVKSKRDIVGERLKAKYPDREYADDDALFGQISEDYDRYDRDLADRDSKISEYQKRERQLSDMMDSDPRSASLLMGIKDGEDPAVGLVRRFGTEIRDFLDDPEKQEEIAKAQAEYLERITKEKDLEALYEKNMRESVEVVSAYQQEKGLSDEQIDKLMESIITVGNDMVVGKFTKETLEMFAKAMNYEADIEAAGAEGEVRGRNAKIDEKLRKPNKGDGTPTLDSRGGGMGPMTAKRDLGAIENMAGSSNIWERGNMRRIKRT